jgi:hypothetical protein
MKTKPPLPSPHFPLRVSNPRGYWKDCVGRRVWRNADIARRYTTINYFLTNLVGASEP